MTGSLWLSLGLGREVGRVRKPSLFFHERLHRVGVRMTLRL